MMADEKEVFLNLEKQATDIIDELNLLRIETDHYSSSSKSLDESVKMIEKLTTSLENNAVELSNLAKLIREVEFESLKTNLDTLSNDATNINSTVNNFLPKADQKLQEHSTRFNVLIGFVLTIIILQVASFII